MSVYIYQKIIDYANLFKLPTGYRMPAPEGTPAMVYALILRCWDKEANNRPHFSDIYSELDRLYTVL